MRKTHFLYETKSSIFIWVVPHTLFKWKKSPVKAKRACTEDTGLIGSSGTLLQGGSGGQEPAIKRVMY